MHERCIHIHTGIPNERSEPTPSYSCDRHDENGGRRGQLMRSPSRDGLVYHFAHRRLRPSNNPFPSSSTRHSSGSILSSDWCIRNVREYAIFQHVIWGHMPGRAHWEGRQERGAGEDRTQAAARTQICLLCAYLKSLPKHQYSRMCKYYL